MVQAAISGRLAHWESTPSSLVALVILLDQFPRSIHAGRRSMYSGDAMARAVVLRAIFLTSIMDDIHPVYRLFPCLALSHQVRMGWWCCGQHCCSLPPPHFFAPLAWLV